MATGNSKVVINLSTGMEDPERVTVAFLVAGAALDDGRKVAMFLTKEAVRLALPAVAEGVACEGCPPLPRLFEQFAEGGGELLTCPICFNTKKLDEAELVPNAKLAARRRSGNGSEKERPCSATDGRVAADPHEALRS